MILDAVIGAFIAPVSYLFMMIQSFTFEISADVFNGLYTLFANIGYIFPIAGLFPIFVVTFTLKGLQISWALLIRIKSFIPTMGA